MNGYRWVIFGLGSGLFLLSMFYRASSAIIAPDLAQDLNLDYETLGLLGASFYPGLLMSLDGGECKVVTLARRPWADLEA